MRKLTSITARGAPIPDLSIFVPPLGTVTISDEDYARSRDVALATGKRLITVGDWFPAPAPATVAPQAPAQPAPKAPVTDRDLLAEAQAQNRLLVEALVGAVAHLTSAPPPVAHQPAWPLPAPVAPIEEVEAPEPERPTPVYIPGRILNKEIQGSVRPEREQGAGVSAQVEALRRLKSEG